jgi:shikimate dehydrogenase
MSLARASARRIVLMNRSLERARIVAEAVASRYPGCVVTAQALHPRWQVSELPEIQLLVNTTSVGLHSSDPLLFAYSSLSAQIMVCDLIYNPPETALLRMARSRGCRATNGMGMLVHQGALAFERWTGKPAPVHVMREAVRT